MVLDEHLFCFTVLLRYCVDVEQDFPLRACCGTRTFASSGRTTQSSSHSCAESVAQMLESVRCKDGDAKVGTAVIEAIEVLEWLLTFATSQLRNFARS